MKKILTLVLVLAILAILAANNAHAEEVVKYGTYFEWEGGYYYDWTKENWGFYHEGSIWCNNANVFLFEGICNDAFTEGFYPDWSNATWFCIAYDWEFLNYEEFDNYSEFKTRFEELDGEEVTAIYVEYGHYKE